MLSGRARPTDTNAATPSQPSVQNNDAAQNGAGEQVAQDDEEDELDQFDPGSDLDGEWDIA